MGGGYRRLATLLGACLVAAGAHAQPDPIVAQREIDGLRAESNRLANAQKFDEALPPAQKAVEIAEAAFGPQDRRTYFALGPMIYALYKLQRYPEVLTLEERRLRMATALFGEKSRQTILAYRNVAIGHANIGDERYELGLPLLEKALRLSIEVLGENDEDTTHMLMVDVANAYMELGRNTEALEMYERQARLVAEKHGPDSDKATAALGTVAIMYDTLGRTLEALPIYEKTLQMAIAKYGEEGRSTLFDMVRLGATYSELGRHEEGIRLLERAVQIKPKVFHPKDREGIHFEQLLANAYMRSGRAREALPLLQRSLALNIEDAGAKSGVSIRNRGQVARAHAVLGEFEQARTIQEQVLAMNREVFGETHVDTIGSLQALAETLEKLGRGKEAAGLYAKVVPAVEGLRASGDLSPEIRQSLFANWVGAYKSYARLLAEEGAGAEAFRLAELSKARTLLESTAMRRANQSSVLAPAERDRVRALEERISKLSDRVAAASGRPEERFRLEAEKNKAISELGALRRELSAKYPKYAQLSDVKIAEAAQAKAVLPADAVLLSFLVNEDQVVAFALSPESLVARNLDGTGVAEKVARYRDIVSNPDRPGGEAVKIAAELGARLLEPFAAQLAGRKRVLISPDGALALLPFEALPLGGEALIAKADVSYVQSLSMLALMTEKDAESRPARRELFAMGGARYGGGASATRRNSRQGSSVGKFLMRGGDLHKAFDLMNLQWDELPGSEKEIDAVAKVFGGERAAVFRKSEATEAKLQQLNSAGELARYRYLLFSAHGFLSTEEPALSSLVLGQVDKAPGTDGYVTAGEWPAYTLASDLVVLSACDTGVGRVVQGEGVTGLPYALYVAGNRNTLLSLWPVVDESTARFMTAFFGKLAAGMPQSVALSATKREFIAGRELDRPLFWAPFVLYGD